MKPGSVIPKYGLFADILAHGLYNVDKEKPVSMELELQDELYLAKMFVEPNTAVPVDAPLALFVEEEEDVASATALSESEVVRLAGQVSGPRRLDSAEPRVLPVLWQAYLKRSEDAMKCSNS
jgi:pyruvate/2-oxoglutarate dehydrogenase complex dihydrolipoamide acyltransferase (E2) component